MASDRFFLIIRAPNGDVREMPLGDHALVVGRDESADIRVDDKKVSRRHAAFKLIEGKPYVEDLGSSNGVRLNGKRIDKKALIVEGDKVRVGGFYVSLKPSAPQTGASVQGQPGPSAPPESISPKSDVARTRAPKVIERVPDKPREDLPYLDGRDPPVEGRRFVLQRGENIVGRLEECDVPILDGSVSRQHARLVFARDRVTATDLGSSNGIFVNGVRVDMAELAQGDELKIGSVRFSVNLPAPIAGRLSGPVQTRARPKATARKGKRWIWLGVAGLVSAALVVGGALWWKLRGGDAGAGAAARLLAAGGLTDDPPDAGAAGVAEPPPAAPPPTSPPPTAVPPPVAPPPAAPPPPAGPPPAAPPPAAPPLAAPKLAAGTRTATSPFTRRGPEGLPLGLPTVDAKFDFDAFVAERLAAAKVCEDKQDFGCLRNEIAALLAADPINPDAKAMATRAETFEKVQASLARADRLVAKGRFADAHRVLVGVIEQAPDAAEAKQRADKIKALAIEDALARAASDAKRASRYERAHRRYLEVLELDPDSEAALSGIRRLERKMRKKKMEFAVYEPPTTPGAAPAIRDVREKNDAILAFYGGDRALAGIAQAYARGAVKKATRRASKVAKSGPRASRRRAQQMKGLLADLKKRYDRTRTEISNDPDRAWSMLLQLEKREQELLPQGLRSFLVKELRVSLSEAFAERGVSMHDRGRFEAAFQRWLSGFKLDPTNPKVRAGLERLERKADTLAQEAELSSQRGDPSSCDKWKQITRMTRAQTEVHKKARERALALCR